MQMKRKKKEKAAGVGGKEQRPRSEGSYGQYVSILRATPPLLLHTGGGKALMVVHHGRVFKTGWFGLMRASGCCRGGATGGALPLPVMRFTGSE